MTTIPIQLDLFEPFDDFAEIKAEIAALKESHHKVRKGVFGRLASQESLSVQILKRLDLIEELMKKK